jgi:hypothetical protein
VSTHAIANAAAGPFAAACLVLGFAGTAKLLRPAGTQAAAGALGLPASPAVVWALGTVELTVAATGIAIGSWAALAVALVYGALAGAAARLLMRAPGTNCGCLGASDAPVSASHVVVDGAAAVVAVLASFGGSPLAAVGDSPAARVAFVAGIGCCAWLATQLLDAVPALNRAARTEGAR